MTHCVGRWTMNTHTHTHIIRILNYHLLSILFYYFKNGVGNIGNAKKKQYYGINGTKKLIRYYKIIISDK